MSSFNFYSYFLGTICLILLLSLIRYFRYVSPGKCYNLFRSHLSRVSHLPIILNTYSTSRLLKSICHQSNSNHSIWAKSLNTISLSFILSSSRTQFRHTSNIYIFFSILILLSGDIQSNSGPISTHSRLDMCTLNIRSITNPLHYTALADLTESNKSLLYLKPGLILTLLQLICLIRSNQLEKYSEEG